MNRLACEIQQNFVRSVGNVSLKFCTFRDCVGQIRFFHTKFDSEIVRTITFQKEVLGCLHVFEQKSIEDDAIWRNMFLEIIRYFGFDRISHFEPRSHHRLRHGVLHFAQLSTGAAGS